MEPQGKYKCLEIDSPTLELGRDEVFRRIESFSEECRGEHFYVVPDYYTDEHADLISNYFSDLPFITGGSGLALSLSRNQFTKSKGTVKDTKKSGSKNQGKALIIAGSCSKATTEQIEEFIKSDGKAIEVDPVRLLKDKKNPVDSELFNSALKATDLLLYTSRRNPEGDRIFSDDEQNEISALLENAMAEMAYEAVKTGITKIVVAGGETSGAVVKKLGYNAFYIRKSVAPGVPVMESADSGHSRLVLKSGNFGQKDFFRRALAAMSDE